MSHLLELGHTRLGFVGPDLSIGRKNDRHLGACAAIAANGRDASLQTFLVAGPTIDAGEHASSQIAAIPASARPTAVFCHNDLVALGVLRGLQRSGLRVPDDVALIGYDDIEYCAISNPPLSSIVYPARDVGRAAAALLLEEVREAQDHRHRHIAFPPTLVPRASSLGSPRTH